MKITKSNFKVVNLMNKLIAVSIAISLCASCDNGNGRRLAKVKNDPAGTYREYLSDIRKQDKFSVKVSAHQFFVVAQKVYDSVVVLLVFILAPRICCVMILFCTNQVKYITLVIL